MSSASSSFPPSRRAEAVEVIVHVVAIERAISSLARFGEVAAGCTSSSSPAAWAGLDADRYSWTAVLHRERGGGVHVHVLTARYDLEIGKSLNIAPPGWQKTFDPLRDAFNHEHG